MPPTARRLTVVLSRSFDVSDMQACGLSNVQICRSGVRRSAVVDDDPMVTFQTIELRAENGLVLDRVVDEGAIARLSQAAPFDNTVCLRFVDPYGETVFNAAQAAVLGRELEARLGSTGEGDREMLARIVELTDRCAGEVHRYVWFIGD
jgi:hypothetical protein